MRGYDVIGNIALIKFSRETKQKDKKKYGEKFLKGHKSVSTVLEKTGKFSGRLRTQSSRFLVGERTKEALYRENDCVFRLNVDSCYFSPRLAGERLLIAGKVKKKEEVLVMFGGVAPFGVAIAKKSRCKRVVSVEIGRDCSKYAEENRKRNKLENLRIVQGDVRKKVVGLGKFDRVVMARPNLTDSFLDVGFRAVRKGGILHYYGFYEESKKGEIRELVNSEAKRARKKIRILRISKAGDVGTRRFRYRVDIKVY